MPKLNKNKKTWLDKLIDFYDFVWIYGLGECSGCINKELFADFTKGGNKFKEMKKAIIKKFPTETAARKAFKKNEKKDT